MQPSQRDGEPQPAGSGSFFDHTAVVDVIGLGYLGLPLAVETARSGYRVLGVDFNPEGAAGINRGESHSVMRGVHRPGRIVELSHGESHGESIAAPLAAAAD